jgi:uncharacterized protein YbbC (DUF1343 family)
MQTRTGLEAVLTTHRSLLAGKRVGLVAHPASVDSRLRHAVQLFHRDPEIRLSAIFGPQHGARGETQDNMIEWEDYRDPQTGLPVYSLYGQTRKPTPAMLSDVDVLVIDLQDVGARYYTFIYTMALAMQACSENGKEVVILDRPNPIGGHQMEGPVLDPAFASFVGLYPLPIRHGMTPGELARYFQRCCGIDCRLEVVPLAGWDGRPYFDRTELPWVPPSPNIPRLESTLVYPGLCLLEGTNVSEGRGTTLPFEISGAPWVDPETLVKRLEGLGLPGLRFRPLHFLPTFHKWANCLCGGVHLDVTDREAFKPFLTGLALVRLYRELGGEWFQWKRPPYEYEYRLLPFDILCGTDRIRRGLEAGASLEEMEASWQPELEAFADRRGEFLLYAG